MDRLKYMKSKLVDCIEKEIDGNLEYTNAQELGEAVDMVKDLSEAIYYCTITEAMEEKSSPYGGHHPSATHYYSDWDRKPGRYEPPYPMYYDGSDYPYGDGRDTGGARYYGGMRRPEYDSYPARRPYDDDRVTMSKRRYMESKMHSDKQAQMRELEMYAQELAQDITDMIKDASPEERQMLQQKINMLATKIK